MSADDLHNDEGVVRKFDVYGYCVVYKPSHDGKWLVDQDEEYRNLPAHYLSKEEALDRVEFLRDKSVPARVAALLAEDLDDAQTFGENRNG